MNLEGVNSLLEAAVQTLMLVDVYGTFLVRDALRVPNSECVLVDEVDFLKTNPQVPQLGAEINHKCQQMNEWFRKFSFDATVLQNVVQVVRNFLDNNTGIVLPPNLKDFDTSIKHNCASRDGLLDFTIVFLECGMRPKPIPGAKEAVDEWTALQRDGSQASSFLEIICKLRHCRARAYDVGGSFDVWTNH